MGAGCARRDCSAGHRAALGPIPPACCCWTHGQRGARCTVDTSRCPPWRGVVGSVSALPVFFLHGRRSCGHARARRADLVVRSTLPGHHRCAAAAPPRGGPPPDRRPFPTAAVAPQRATAAGSIQDPRRDPPTAANSNGRRHTVSGDAPRARPRPHIPTRATGPTPHTSLRVGATACVGRASPPLRRRVVAVAVTTAVAVPDRPHRSHGASACPAPSSHPTPRRCVGPPAATMAVPGGTSASPTRP
ncbi:hypothetical protein BU14_0608s0016 [Porphyra umbilicalis]|uniref:Uncharacterized protein n=1 Tax=Porphyra umbilicalis TaxID=2786 RepID=A0A1X6NRB2_PORUM|nr:hypothetical protein BU14_0608s0016 [Porphyra umbilicalis]|eukprot:OSX71070.1 hypothetical protein BU14_0608s0016 [Porphyra umbilicalis]